VLAATALAADNKRFARERRGPGEVGLVDRDPRDGTALS